MSRILGRLQRRSCRAVEIGLRDERASGRWPVEEVLLASVAAPHATRYMLAVLDAVLEGEALTRFLALVAPFGCPTPGSLIRAYSLPDAPYPSILLKEHEEAPEGLGDAYRRFVDGARRHWLAALQETGRGLCPLLAWEAGLIRRFLAPDEWPAALAEVTVALPGIADGYLGRGLAPAGQPGSRGFMADRDVPGRCHQSSPHHRTRVPGVG